MNNLGSIGEILFFVPVAVLFLAIVGLVWTPFGTLICAFVAHFRGLKGEPYATAAAKSSILLLLPWVYLVIRLSFARSLSRFAVMPVYVLIYATWFYFAALSVGGACIYHRLVRDPIKFLRTGRGRDDAVRYDCTGEYLHLHCFLEETPSTIRIG